MAEVATGEWFPTPDLVPSAIPVRTRELVPAKPDPPPDLVRLRSLASKPILVGKRNPG